MVLNGSGREDLFHQREMKVPELSLNTEDGLGDHFIKALALKEEGNKLLLNCNYALAAEKYTDAIKLYPTAILLSNRAQALLKIESYGLAIEDANEAIRL